jgi:hypothetical protein
MYILEAERFVDVPNPNSRVTAKLAEWQRQSYRVIKLTIDPLAAGWSTPLEPHHYRSGCAPLEALHQARELLKTDSCEVVVLECIDLLRSTYAGNKGARQKLMEIYGPLSIPEGYTRLAYDFLEREKITEAQFEKFSSELFANFQRTARRWGLPVNPPAERWAKLTSLFREVDCANPVVDFTARVALGSSRILPRLGLNAKSTVQVRGISVNTCSEDGPSFISQISRYSHLGQAFSEACRESSVDFLKEFQKGQALLEVYSCFPIVPLAFLLKCGFMARITDCRKFLADHEISITGGMNLAKAPWNGPVLNAIVALVERMTAEKIRYGGVHGNGGLGYKQGFAIFSLGP